MDLYKLLNLSKDASEGDVSRSYRRLALQYHPDRNPEGADTFRKLSDAYTVLSDPAKRGIYDMTGVVPGSEHDEENDAERDEKRFAELGTQLNEFYHSYRGSSEEQTDFMKIFEKCKGNFVSMVDSYLLFDNKGDNEVERLLNLGAQLIADGSLNIMEGSKSEANWNKTTTNTIIRKLQKRLKRERAEAEEIVKNEHGVRNDDIRQGSGGGGGMDALRLQIANRAANNFNAMTDSLMAKYCGGSEGTKEKRKKKKSDAAKKDAPTTVKSKKMKQP